MNNILTTLSCSVCYYQVVYSEHPVPWFHQSVLEQHPQGDPSPGQQGASARAGAQVCLLPSTQLLLILLSSILHHLWRAGWLWAWTHTQTHTWTYPHTHFMEPGVIGCCWMKCWCNISVKSKSRPWGRPDALTWCLLNQQPHVFDKEWAKTPDKTSGYNTGEGHSFFESLLF